MSTSPKKHDYDTEWKDIITDLFDDFVKFFLPQLYLLVDFTKPHIFLDKEFRQLTKTKKGDKKGRSFKDKLVKVVLKSGKTLNLLIHIEVQSSKEAGFPNRMFKYFCRIRERFNMNLSALAVYTNYVPKNYDSYSYKFLDTEVLYKFHTYRINNAEKEALLASDNPFALIVLASQYLNKTINDAPQRLQFKIELLRLARKKEYNAQQIRGLLTFIEYLLILPKELEEEAEAELRTEYDKTISTMPATEHSKRLMTDLYKRIFGISVEEKVRRETAKAERETAKAERETAKAEQETAKAEQETAKARQEAAKARQEAILARKNERETALAKKKVEQETAQYKMKFIKALAELGKTPEEISASLNIPLGQVKKLMS